MKSYEPRRSRHRLILTCLLFVASQLVLGLLFDYRWPLVRSQQLANIVERLSDFPASPDVVFMGSSRFNGSIRENEIARLVELECQPNRTVGVLNASVAAADPIAVEQVLGTLLDSGVRPRLVVIELAPEWINRSNFCYQYNIVRNMRWEHLPEHLSGMARSNQLGRLVTTRLLPVFQYREHLWQIGTDALATGKVSHPLAVSPLSFGAPAPRTPTTTVVPWQELLQASAPPMSPILERTIRDGAADVGRRWLQNFSVSPVSRRYLDLAVERCRRNGIEVLIVVPPLTVAHRGLYTPTIEEGFQTFLAEFTCRAGCRALDCRDWLPDEMFSDSHHVNDHGALLFSRLIARRVVVPWYRSDRMAKKD